MAKKRPWYAEKNQDALFYLLIAIFFLELVVGGVAFFYGIIHAKPEIPGGPPLARFPWFAWGLAAVLAPVALLMLTHLAGAFVSEVLEKEGNTEGAVNPGAEAPDLPPGLNRFYASVRHAPAIVLLMATLGIGGAIFFIDGAFAALGKFATSLVPYLPWLAGSFAALLAICFLAHAFFVYRQRKMENEYAWRREVLEKTGLVIVDKKSAALPQESYRGALPSAPALIDVKSLPSPDENGKLEEEKK